MTDSRFQWLIILGLSLTACVPAPLAAPTAGLTPVPTDPTASPATTLRGTLLVGDWAKTTESYCHGGSEYFALATATGDYGLNSERDLPYAREHAEQWADLNVRFAALINQPVALTGELITRTFAPDEHCPDPTRQCLSGPLTCTWIRVSNVHPLDAYP